MRRKHTVVIGCGFAGIIAAIELKTRLGSEHDITVVSATDQFVFTPALTRLCFGSVDTGKYTFCIPPELEKRGIRFVHETVTYINLHERALFTKRGWELYDYLVIATGAKANYAGIPGLGARGYTQAILSISDAEKARAAWHRFMESPGPIVIGMAQGALYSSAVHEFLFRTVHEIWKRGLENQASITYVTFAPILEPSSKENGSTKGGRITELYHN